MEMTYTSANGRLTFKVEVPTGKAAFECIAAIQEVFEVEACGCCRSTAVRCDVREFGGNKYFKMLCSACGATLDLGQNKDGKGLFLKSVDKDRNPLPNGGWYVYGRSANQ